jgi:ubiquitin carboxyl-terminal hydrolase 36/42
MHQANGHKRFICPDPIVNNISSKFPSFRQDVLQRLSEIAKHFRRGRQEDAHEFLRYLIEAMQKSCLAGLGKVDHKVAETTWVYRLFGGRLRSRVKCRNCGHPSDTFDSVLDLSIDVNGVRNLKESLHKFVKLDVLKGADRYKCGKCKQFVVADKGFTVHDAPTILTIHMKRFTPFGRKIVNPVRYEEHLDLQPYMSEGQVSNFSAAFSVLFIIRAVWPDVSLVWSH